MSKVLIVEDNKDLAKALSIRLKANQLEPLVAEDAFTAIRTAVRERPAVVLLDIGLPGESGFTVAEKLNKLSNNTMPIIFITASKNPERKDKALSYDPVAYFEKPYDSQKLMDVVLGVLKGVEPPTEAV